MTGSILEFQSLYSFHFQALVLQSNLAPKSSLLSTASPVPATPLGMRLPPAGETLGGSTQPPKPITPECSSHSTSKCLSQSWQSMMPTHSWKTNYKSKPAPELENQKVRLLRTCPLLFPQEQAHCRPVINWMSHPPPMVMVIVGR